MPLSAVHSPILYTFVVSVSAISDTSSIVFVDSEEVSVVVSDVASVISIESLFSFDEFNSVSRLEAFVSSSAIVASFSDMVFSKDEILEDFWVESSRA